jgi:RHS repeat-associated protein
LREMAHCVNSYDRPHFRLEFAYDSQGRRVRKLIKTWNGASFSTLATNLFINDGLSLVAVLNSQITIQQSFLWGPDLSEGMSAGGVGGLVCLLEMSGGQISTAHFAAYDGNGNVTALVNGTLGSSARYEYSPFGDAKRITGYMGIANPFRFSTRFTDNESSLLVYPERYYNPRTGRWLSRDPIGEQGGINLYSFLLNSPIASFDPRGHFTLTEQQAVAATAGLLILGAATADFIKQGVSQAFAGWNARQIGTYATTSTDANDDSLEEDLEDMNMQLVGQLSNQLNKFNNDDDDGKDKRRSQTRGQNTKQNELTDNAARECRLSNDGKEMLKQLVEKYSRGPHGDDTPLDYATIKQMAQELAETSAKYRLP